MSQQVEYRNSVRFIPAAIIGAMGSFGFALLGLITLGSKLPNPWPMVLGLLLTISFVVKVIHAAFAVRLRRLKVQEGSLVLTDGLLTPIVRSTPISKTSSVQLDEAWHLRLFGLTETTIVSQGAEASALVMPGLLRQDALRLVELVDSGNSETTDDELTQLYDLVQSTPETELDLPLTPACGQREQAFVCQPTRHDMIATLGTRAVVLLVAGFAFIDPISDLLQLWGVDLWSSAATNVAAMVLVVILVVTGAAITAILRFHGFRIHSDDRSSYTISYGAIERISHSVLREQIVAAEIKTSMFDFIMGTRQICFSTAKLKHSSMREIQFPSLSEHEASRVLHEVTGLDLRQSLTTIKRTWLLVPISAVIVATGVALALQNIPTWTRALCILGAFIVAIKVLRYVTSTIWASTDASYLICRSIGMSHSVMILTAPCVYGSITRWIPGRALGNITLLGFAHRRLLFRRPVFSQKESKEIDLMLQSSKRYRSEMENPQ